MRAFKKKAIISLMLTFIIVFNMLPANLNTVVVAAETTYKLRVDTSPRQYPVFGGKVAVGSKYDANYFDYVQEGNYSAGEQVKAKASPTSEYKFKEWRKGSLTGEIVSTEPDITITMEASDITYYAVFTPIDERTKIDEIVANCSELNNYDTLEYGQAVKNDFTFNVTSGSPAYIVAGAWHKLNEETNTWEIYNKQTFEDVGEYNYFAYVRLDKTYETTHKLALGYMDGTINGEYWDAETYVETNDYTQYTLQMNNARVLNGYKVEPYIQGEEKGTVSGGGTYPDGKMVTVSATPDAGYEVKGWYQYNNLQTENKDYTFKVYIPQGHTPYVVIERGVYSVEFETNGAGTIKTQKVNGLDKAQKPTDPIKEGYLFKGWYEDNKLTKEFDFNTPIVENKILYAKWEEKKAAITLDKTSIDFGNLTINFSEDKRNLTLQDVTITNTGNIPILIKTDDHELVEIIGINSNTILEPRNTMKCDIKIAYSTKEDFKTAGKKTWKYKILGIDPDGKVNTAEAYLEFKVNIVEKATIIKNAECTITKPIDEKNPVFKAVAKDTKYVATITSWYLCEDPYPELATGDKFVEGKTYAVRVDFTPKGEYEFDDTTKFKINGEETLQYTLWSYGGREARFVAGPAVPFSDVKTNSWYYPAVKYVYQNGIMTGGAKFEPNTKVTRGMLATIIYKMEGAPQVSGKTKFSDVQDSSKYYFKAVKWAADNRVVSGYPDGRFGPTDYVTREQLAVILHNYARYKKKDLSKEDDLKDFADANKVGNYAKSSVKWAVATKVITGGVDKKTGKNILNPKGQATRAEIAAMIQKYCLRVGK